MSYDLFFTQPDISLKEYLSYFKKRENYSLKENKALYLNEDTGVYFWFDYSYDKPKDPEAPEGRISFEMNYYRPHFFALEAEIEIRAFVEYFNFEIFDPQIDGMGAPTFDSEGFLRGWNHGNDVSYKSFLQDKDQDREVSRPWDELEAIWHWNYHRKELQNKLGVNIFVPAIMFLQVDSKLLSTVAWTDAVPTLIPQVDALFVYRDKLAPGSFLFRKKDFAVVPFDQALLMLAPFENNNYGIKTYSLPTPNTPANIVEYVKNLKPHSGPAERVEMYQILDFELVVRYGS